MAYSIHYIFCATPFDGDAELKMFHEAMAEFNHEEAMPKGLLFASLVVVPAMADKRPFQSAVNDNIRMSRYYIQVVEDSWGPPQRDYERDWALAKRCALDPELPMRETAMFFKAPLLPHKVDPAIPELQKRMLADGELSSEFDHPNQFRDALRATLSRWLETVIAEEVAEPVNS